MHGFIFTYVNIHFMGKNHSDCDDVEKRLKQKRWLEWSSKDTLQKIEKEKKRTHSVQKHTTTKNRNIFFYLFIKYFKSRDVHIHISSCFRESGWTCSK